MRLAELERLQPELMPVLRGRAADWCQRNGLAEEALEYAIAAGDLDTVARLLQDLWTPTYRHGRFATLQRWFRWLDERGGMARYPAVVGQIALIAANTGRPAEAERWADMADRRHYQDAPGASDPGAEAWAAVTRAVLCRRGVRQMSVDADEAVQKLAAANIVAPVAGLCQGSRGSCPVIPMAATHPWRIRPASRSKSVRMRSSRSRWASGRCWPWHAVTGARPRRWPVR